MAESGRSPIVAGPNEKSFAEKYGSEVELPMDEARFLALLDRLKLKYRVDRNRRSRDTIPPPQWSQSLDLSAIQRMYVIHGDYNADTGTTEQYRAYVNAEGQVVYIENRFIYPPIG